MEKVIRNGKVAVLTSPGYGAGWSTWNGSKEILVFHPLLVAMVESGKSAEITSDWITENLGISDVYVGGAEDLCISWIEEGKKFLITEYDGAESVVTEDDLSCYTA